MAMRAPFYFRIQTRKKFVMNIPSILELKNRAKRLRNGLKQQGQTISHAQSLELLANEFGMKDWNTLFASAGNSSPPFYVGQKVEGEYLGQSFSATIHGLSHIGEKGSGYNQITLDFEEPVDVVTFESFSNFRHRINATIYESGNSPQNTSNGKPQLSMRPA